MNYNTQNAKIASITEKLRPHENEKSTIKHVDI